MVVSKHLSIWTLLKKKANIKGAHLNGKMTTFFPHNAAEKLDVNLCVNIPNGLIAFDKQTSYNCHISAFDGYPHS